MRPQAAGSTPAGSPSRRKSSITNTSTGPAVSSPTTFFMASQSMLDAEQTPIASMSDTTFGIRSLAEDPTPLAEETAPKEEGRRRSTIIASRTLVRDMSKDSLSMGSFASSSGSDISSPSRPPQTRRDIGDALQQRIPSALQSPILSISEPSSPNPASVSSPSDDDILDDRNSQAIMSDSEDDIPAAPISDDNATAPQLIMPSIMMPSRRPFSENGNAMGRLKILLAGSSGTGKTSLIKSIVQTCEDIVHIDATSSKTTRSKKSPSYNKTKHIVETYASTKAYASWWADLEESKVLRRRSSGNGIVLERNICFVDTPGYDSGTSILEGMDNVVQYIEKQASAALNVRSLDDSDLLHLLGGGGSTQVDVVLYLLAHPIKPADLEFLKQLSTVSNIVPLLARADSLSFDELEQIRTSITDTLTAAGIKTFSTSLQNPANHVHTVCSSPSKDLENMDASLLMQSDYIQPLASSDLSSLTKDLFTAETIEKLKYFAARKIIQNRGSLQALVHGTSSPDFLPRTGHSTTPSSQALISRSPKTISYGQAAVTDHTIREERLARVHLANWATNLQRSLANERARYEAIARAERAEWLKARLGECVIDQDITGSETTTQQELVLVRKKSSSSVDRRPQYTRYLNTFPDRDDPLGLIRWRNIIGVVSQVGFIGFIGGCIFISARDFAHHAGYPAVENWWDGIEHWITSFSR